MNHVSKKKHQMREIRIRAGFNVLSFLRVSLCPLRLSGYFFHKPATNLLFKRLHVAQFAINTFFVK